MLPSTSRKRTETLPQIGVSSPSNFAPRTTAAPVTVVEDDDGESADADTYLIRRSRGVPMKRTPLLDHC